MEWIPTRTPYEVHYFLALKRYILIKARTTRTNSTTYDVKDFTFDTKLRRKKLMSQVLKISSRIAIQQPEYNCF